MEQYTSKISLVVLALLLASSACLNTYTSTFSTNQFVTVGATISPRSFQAYPMYPLGQLTAGMTLRFVFDVPNQTSLPLANLTMYMHVGQSTHLRRPTSDFSNSLCTGDPSYNGMHCEFTYLVQVTDYHAIEVRDFITVAGSQFVQHFTMYVTYFNSSLPQSVGNTNVQTLLNIVDIFRTRIYRVVYLSSPSTYKVTLHPFTTGQTSKAVRLFPITYGQPNAWPYTRTNQFTGSALTFDGPSEVATYDTSLQTSSVLTAGYYLLEVQFDANVHQVASAYFTWQSDSYACPYQPSFNDFYSTFQACSQRGSSQSTWPCSDFNPQLNLCFGCVSGYQLINNRCIKEVSCQPRFYFNFGQCYPVNPLCGDFEFYGGKCLTCADPTNYLLVNGTCVNKNITVNCGERQFLNGSVCQNVSDEC